MAVRIKYKIVKFCCFFFFLISLFQIYQIKKWKNLLDEKTTYLTYYQELSKKMKNESYKIEKFRLYNLSHVIIPFHIKQLKSLTENIKKWSVYRPCFEDDYFNRKMPKLIFYVGYTNDETIKNLYYKLGDLLPYFRCFSNRYSIDIVKFKFSKKRDKHIVGARLMFEHVLAKKHYLFKHASYVFYIEPDCRPIRSGWIDALQKEIGFNGFWIKGAMFRGKFEMKINKYLPNKYHINGNAIYNIGDRKFEDFYFKKLRPYIQRHNDSITAYDTDFFEYLFDLKNYDTVRMIVQNFAFTETIQNLWLTNYSVKEIRKKYPKTFLVHGGQQNGA